MEVEIINVEEHSSFDENSDDVAAFRMQDCTKTEQPSDDSNDNIGFDF